MSISIVFGGPHRSREYYNHYESNDLQEAVTAFNATHPNLGPKNIVEIEKVGRSREVRYPRWEIKIKEMFKELPFPDYSAVYKEWYGSDREGIVYLPCPRCHEDVGYTLWKSLPEEKINIFLGVERFEWECRFCGSEIGEWAHQHFNAAVALYRDVYGDDREEARKLFANFQNATNISLARFGEKGERNLRILLEKYGFLGVRLSNVEIARARSLSVTWVGQILNNCLGWFRSLRDFYTERDVAKKLLIQRLEREDAELRSLLYEARAEISNLRNQLRVQREEEKPPLEYRMLAEAAGKTIYDLEISNRTSSAVTREWESIVRETGTSEEAKTGVYPLTILLRLTPEDLLSLRNFGEKSLEGLRSALAKHNLRLRGD